MDRVYLDVSCLNRPYDDQTQGRVRLEAEAVLMILAWCDQKRFQHTSSTIATVEIDAMRDPDRKRKVRASLPAASDIIQLDEPSFRRAEELIEAGFKPADALHLAGAEKGNADVFLSCDDRLCRRAKRCRLHVRVVNPVDFVQEFGNAENT